MIGDGSLFSLFLAKMKGKIKNESYNESTGFKRCAGF